MGKPEKIKGSVSFARFRIGFRTVKIDQLGFLRVDRQSIFLKPLIQHLQDSLCIGSVFKTDDEVSQPRELPPRLLSEPSVNLSAHWAPIIQPTALHPASSEETDLAVISQSARVCVPLFFCGALAF